MKARIKATGEIIEVVPDSTNRYYHDSDLGTLVYNEVDLQFDFTDYWQQVRIQAAIAAVSGITANETFIQYDNEGEGYEKWVANTSVKIADALVAELKKKKE